MERYWSLGECEEFSAKGWQAHGSAGRSGQCEVDFHGEKRSNETHESKTDPDAKLARKNKAKEDCIQTLSIPRTVLHRTLHRQASIYFCSLFRCHTI
jgi:hypothetical protein